MNNSKKTLLTALLILWAMPSFASTATDTTIHTPAGTTEKAGKQKSLREKKPKKKVKKVRYQQLRDNLQYAGWLEWVCVQPSKQVFKAKLDTGAKTSSVHATDIVSRTQNGEEWVDFTLTDRRGKTQQYSKAVVRQSVIKEHDGEKQIRPVVMMALQLGETLISTEVNLVDRTGLNYPLLLGRLFLKDQLIVDPGIKFNIKTDCQIE